MPSDDRTEYSVFDDEQDATDSERGRGNADDARDAGDPGGRGTDAGDPDPDGFGEGDDDGCPKCGAVETETDSIATSGTGLTKLFDVQNRRFIVVSCAECGYSELYKGQSRNNAIDFFVG